MNIEERIIKQIGQQSFDQLTTFQQQLRTLNPYSREYFDLAGKCCVLDHGANCACFECQTFVYGAYEENVNYENV